MVSNLGTILRQYGLLLCFFFWLQFTNPILRILWWDNAAKDERRNKALMRDKSINRRHSIKIVRFVSYILTSAPAHLVKTLKTLKEKYKTSNRAETWTFYFL